MLKTSLEKLLLEIPDLKKLDYLDPIFKNWIEKFKRLVKKEFGENSPELSSLNRITFWIWYSPAYEGRNGVTKEEYEKNVFIKGLKEAELLLNDLIEEAKGRLSLETSSSTQGKFSKIFISHSKKDKDIVDEIIDGLLLIGVEPKQIFCTSIAGYGIELGEDFLERIKNELNGEVLVIFVLTENYYSSPVCLCEMGATWVQTKYHIPCVVAPFSFEDIKGVIPNTQGLKITDKFGWNSLKTKLEEKLEIEPKQSSIWENGRDKILARLDNILRLKKAP
ncbi:toll/interleukin-1 receptor domain-containing protein [Cyclobacterium qasimii]|uniref:TIR domain-containing protein n=2 Tax=Cyclobacterium qasimii TaxID=1350429 RepID=S7VI49_9BACT|nr:toll/interleukin-1 receptor domain-containing protein [Cyclobacterium qasimii]EPR69187.1 hypothetical protein ADICYQ_1687 [Cyclobacterium qasimii M12-11B]GEO21013.1 hypothetical protein CQA01_15470 [Cyclobacterium qasimii]